VNLKSEGRILEIRKKPECRRPKRVACVVSKACNEMPRRTWRFRISFGSRISDFGFYDESDLSQGHGFSTAPAARKAAEFLKRLIHEAGLGKVSEFLEQVKEKEIVI
jgi:hypothetical protein